MKTYTDGIDDGIIMGKNAVLDVLDSYLNGRMDDETIVSSLKRYLEMREPKK